MDTKQHYSENELTLWACTNRQMKKISGLFLWCGRIIGVLIMGLLRLIGKYFGLFPLVVSMAVISLLLVVATIKIALPAMREKKQGTDIFNKKK